mmetsp:Transcript_20739/g.49278  ORF Transcript_20739/g.49278 Transcript_20739/m.49278 type:complete len:239 (-) Transcript_20739:643-1359(-)
MLAWGGLDTSGSEVFQGGLDDGDALVNFRLSDDKGRGQSDDVVMRRLAEESALLELHAYVPGGDTLGFIDDERIKQTPTTNLSDERRVHVVHFRPKLGSQSLGALHEPFVFDDLECCNGCGTTHRVAAIGRTVCAGSDDIHDMSIGHNHAHWVNSPTDRLPHDDQVWANVVVLDAKHTASARNAGLNLVRHKQHVVLLAQFGSLCKVTIIRNENTGFALNWFNHEGRDFLPVLLQSPL